MPTQIDLYWSFRSPYSYLALKKIRNIEARRDVTFNGGTNWIGYVMRDIFRIAQMTDQVIMPPKPDPIVQDLATTKIAKDQPYIWQLSYLGLLAKDAGKALPFIDEVSQIIWSGNNWYEGDALAEATSRAGLNLNTLKSQINGQEAQLKARLEQHDKDLRNAGHWGVPTCVVNQEPFFGMDRLDALEWRLDQSGVA